MIILYVTQRDPPQNCLLKEILNYCLLYWFFEKVLQPKYSSLHSLCHHSDMVSLHISPLNTYPCKSFFTRYIFARFGGVIMNEGEEPGGGDWTCDTKGEGWRILSSDTQSYLSCPRKCSNRICGTKPHGVLPPHCPRWDPLGVLVLSSHSHQPSALYMGNQVKCSESTKW